MSNQLKTKKMKNKVIPEGMELCPVCEGKGEAFFSCCTGEVVADEYPICPAKDCLEHLGESECEDCQGTGLVKIEDHIQTEPKYDWILRADMLNN